MAGLPAAMATTGVLRGGAAAASSAGGSSGLLGSLGGIGTAAPWVLLGILAFLAGGHIDQEVSNKVDERDRNKLLSYLNGTNSNKDALNVFTDNPTARNVSDWSGLFGVADPLTTGAISGISHAYDTGNTWEGIGKGASNLLTGGISGIVDFFQNQERQKELNRLASGLNSEDFKNFNNDELEALLDYYTDNKGFWFFNRDDIDEEALLRDYQDYLKWREEVGDMPEDIDYDQLYSNVDNAIAGEVKSIADIYDTGMERNTNLLNEALKENNAAFSDYRNQILTNDAMAQQQIAGSTRFELERQQRNAISRGASAAQRLVSNINSQLGMQAQSAQQSLNTSNALAQQLLNHRQAQAGIRSEYSNAMNSYDTQRASLRNGLFERRQAARAAANAEAKQRYNDAMEQWERRLNSYAGSSPFADLYRTQQTRNNTRKSTYDGY